MNTRCERQRRQTVPACEASMPHGSLDNADRAYGGEASEAHEGASDMRADDGWPRDESTTGCVLL